MPTETNTNNTKQKNKYTLDQKKFAVECATLIALFVYTTIAGCNLKVANDTFNAANRPYVGTDVFVRFLSIGKNGTRTVTPQPTKDTVDMEINGRAKNWGPVPGTNFVGDWNVLVAGVQMQGQKIPSAPVTIFPTQDKLLFGDLGSGNYPFITNGTKTLIVEMTVKYDGPSGHYDYCEKYQYAPDVAAFADLGPICSQ